MNCEPRALSEHWNFSAKNVDGAWDLLDWLAGEIYEFETSCANFFSPFPSIPNYALLVYAIWNCSGHDSNSYPCDISVDSFAKLSNKIETINGQQIEFANKVREYDL